MSSKQKQATSAWSSKSSTKNLIGKLRGKADSSEEDSPKADEKETPAVNKKAEEWTAEAYLGYPGSLRLREEDYFAKPDQKKTEKSKKENIQKGWLCVSEGREGQDQSKDDAEIDDGELVEIEVDNNSNSPASL